MNTPNKLTVLRLIMVPAFLLTLLYWNKFVALALFILASMTDWLDGYLARKNNEITNFGKFMDPLADKMLVTSALVAFAALGQLPAWVTMAVIGRDLAVDGLRMVAASRSVVMAAGKSGKVKTAVTMVVICFMIVFNDVFWLNAGCAAIILALNVWSMADYFLKNGHILFEDD